MAANTHSRKSLFGRSLLRCVNIAVGAVTVMCAYGGWIDPRLSVIPAFAVMLFPVMVVVCLMLLVTDLFVSRRLSLWMAATFVLVCGPLFDVFPLHLSNRSKVEKASPDSVFTMMSYNTFGMVDISNSPDSIGGEPYNATLAALIKYHPDIACLQEARAVDNKAFRRLYPSQTDTLCRLYPYQKDIEGHVFLSRFPLTFVGGLPRGDTFSAECVRTRIEGHDIYFVSVHMQSIGLTADDKALFRELTDMEATKSKLKEARHELGGKLASAFRARADQADEVRNFVDSLKGNIIVCGDFNDVPACFALRTVQDADFRNAYSDGASGYKVSYNRNRFYFRIDHILYKGDMDAICTDIARAGGSDHYPVLATFKWK